MLGTNLLSMPTKQRMLNLSTKPSKPTHVRMCKSSLHPKETCKNLDTNI